ncbi:GNAT family N-acetyltransferase [Flavobacterium cyclinae]|uniref:GNAT family N-acetyltransferase n=1 Tax=Flavobacterium cyclinae TaxID=2895947 RepID=UPI001E3307E9|nr:GNAT family N-acetyltransferase [Flavobacterium cyclinae]UGS21111.1 GNAT family N-acetyltransferase [Flavobacterium cyclinae]
MINQLDWDSNFFELQIAECFIDNQSVINVEKTYDLIYVFCNSDKDINLPGYSESYKENKIVYIKDLVKNQLDSENILSFSSKNFSREQLYELSFESGKYSRFKKDKKFSIQQFENLYKRWIDNSLDFGFSDDILVYVEEKKIIGFISYKIKKNEATIGLVAVLPNHQGKGIGKKLLQVVENELIKNDIKILNIPTQKENFEACSFYEKQGYKVKQSIIIKHFWRNDSI